MSNMEMIKHFKTNLLGRIIVFVSMLPVAFFALLPIVNVSAQAPKSTECFNKALQQNQCFGNAVLRHRGVDSAMDAITKLAFGRRPIPTAAGPAAIVPVGDGNLPNIVFQGAPAPPPSGFGESRVPEVGAGPFGRHLGIEQVRQTRRIAGRRGGIVRDADEGLTHRDRAGARRDDTEFQRFVCALISLGGETGAGAGQKQKN